MIGRIMPALMPCLRASTIALRDTRAVIPQDTMQTSASSIMNASHMHSFFSISAYRSKRSMFSRSSSAGLR